MNLGLAILLTTIGATATPLPPASNFILWGWWGPPPAEIEIKNYKAAGFNTITISNLSKNAEAIRIANSEDLRVFLAPEDLASFREDMEAAAVREMPNVQGWILREEATQNDVGMLSDKIQKLRALDKVRWPLVSVASERGSLAWSKTASALAQSGNPAIIYHQNLFLEGAADDEAGFFRNIEAARHIGQQSKMPFLGMVQVAKYHGGRATSESDIRMQAYSYMASGARGLCYFTYWGFPLNDAKKRVEKSMIDVSRMTSNYSLEIVTRLNEEVRSLAPRLLTLKSEGIYFAGDVPQGQQPLPVAGTPLKAVNAERAIVGIMKDAEGGAWAMVVNRRHGEKKSAKTQKSTMQLLLAEDVKAVWEIDRRNGFEKEIPIESGSFYITIPGGTGSLFRFQRG
jgi:hypothetical protein